MRSSPTCEAIKFGSLRSLSLPPSFTTLSNVLKTFKDLINRHTVHFFLQTQGFHQNTSSRRNKSPNQNQNTRSRLKQVKLNENFSSNFFFSVFCYLLLRSLQCSSSARLLFLSTSTDPLLSLLISEHMFPRRRKTTTANVVVCVRGSRDVVFAGSRALFCQRSLIGF